MRIDPLSPAFTRRDVLRHGLAAGGAVLLGTLPLEPLAAACADPFAGGRIAGRVPFAGAETNPPFHELIGLGLDARRYTDLSDLAPDRLVTPTARFFVRTSRPDGLQADEAWRIAIDGLVARPLELALRDLEPLTETIGPLVLECAGNNDPRNFGLMSAATWTGAPVLRLIERARPLPRATRLLVTGADEHRGPAESSLPGASWIFSLDELAAANALLATGMNGERLPPDHGRPVRLLVPGWYGCTAIKWVTRLTLVDDEAPATLQMKEFAARTHQDGVPVLARDYRPAAMELAAFPIRVEKWLVGGRLQYRVIGIVWGGRTAVDRLRIRFRVSEPFREIDLCPPPSNPLMWALWSCPWRPAEPGPYDIVLKPADPSVPARRLDMYFYARRVWIDEV
ncbi:MAG TPA: molybdopterin-dependent oxidoreductase [Vicinamibacterales bacterium]|nr:molybdopterin-dependent oxidoreductase [Vicinamibacterales bacterium]